MAAEGPRMARSSSPNIAYAMVMLMIRKDRTCVELHRLLGVTRATADRHIAAMQDEGLIEPTAEPVRSSNKGPAARAWRWIGGQA